MRHIINKEQAKTVRLTLFTFIMVVGLLGFYTHLVSGQTPTTPQTTTQKITDVQEQVQSAGVQLDTTTAVTAGSIALGGIALGKEYMSTKKLKKEDRATDKDTGTSLLIRYRLIQSMEQFVPGMKEALDQPFNTDTMQKDVTIRKKVAEDAQAWAEYMMTVLQAFPPSMTPSAGITSASVGNTQTQSATPNIEVKSTTLPASTTSNNLTSQNTDTTPK